MTFKTGLRKLRSYIESEEELCTKRTEKGIDSNMEQAVINEKNWNIRILKDILQELETTELKLNVAFFGPNATDLPHITSEQFNKDGVRLEGKGGILTASVESIQTEYVVFWISNVISVSSGAITIADLIYNKIKNYKNTKTRVGKSEFSSSVTLDDLRKIIREELERIKKEDLGS